jgi:hypothetical protein
MSIVYGVDTQKLVFATDVRDAIVNCFVIAHNEILDDLKNYVGQISDEEFDNIKRLNTTQLIRNMFEEVNGNFEEPNKETIMRVLEKLKEFSVHFRKPEIIEKHYSEIMTLVNCLK